MGAKEGNVCHGGKSGPVSRAEGLLLSLSYHHVPGFQGKCLG